MKRNAFNEYCDENTKMICLRAEFWMSAKFAKGRKLLLITTCEWRRHQMQLMISEEVKITRRIAGIESQQEISINRSESKAKVSFIVCFAFASALLLKVPFRIKSHRGNCHEKNFFFISLHSLLRRQLSSQLLQATKVCLCQVNIDERLDGIMHA